MYIVKIRRREKDSDRLDKDKEGLTSKKKQRDKRRWGYDPTVFRNHQHCETTTIHWIWVFSGGMKIRIPIFRPSRWYSLSYK